MKRILTLLALVLAGCTEVPGPNVLLITVDTLRADYLGSYGFPYASSPAMDALAGQGVVFERAVAASPKTAPSHATIMSGRYVREHSVGYMNGETRLVGGTTLAERFRTAGYQTGAFVGNVVLRRPVGLVRGFDVYDDELPQAELNRPFVFERIASETTERAAEWLASADGPFFLWVHYQDPHGPYTPPPEFLGKAGVPTDDSEKPLRLMKSNWVIGGLPPYQKLEGLWRSSEYRARYADEIRSADASIGRLLSLVDGHASARPAIVLLTSDHGESLGENQSYFQHGLSSLPPEAHVPLLLRAPGLTPGRREEVVHHVDVLPTLLELGGLAPESGVSGIALAPYLRSGEPLPERIVYCDAGPEASGYSAERFTRVYPAIGAWELQAAVPERTYVAYPWEPGSLGEMSPVEDDARGALSAYVERAARMVDAGEQPGADDRERLKALGYLD